jgi:hypothetical protein
MDWRFSGATLRWPFSNFRFGVPQTGSIADRDWFAEALLGCRTRPLESLGLTVQMHQPIFFAPRRAAQSTPREFIISGVCTAGAGLLGGEVWSSEFSPNQKMIDGDRAAAVHQEIERGHGPHQREFEAHLVPEKSAHSPAFVVRSRPRRQAPVPPPGCLRVCRGRERRPAALG